jgi:hypothetical protein
MTNDLQSLIHALRDFAQAREWEQFHSPKNLAAALSVEAADVLLYLLQLTDKLGIDLCAAARAKMLVNAQKYPVKGR